MKRLFSPTFITIMTVFCVSLVAGVSCKRHNVKNDASPNSSPTEQEENAPSSTDQKRYKKFQAYIQCTNQYTKDVMGILKDYFSWALPETGPTPKNIKNANGIRAFYTDPKECAERMRQTAKQKPSFADLDTPAIAYADALEKLARLAKEMHRYYEFKDYESTDTNLAKAQQLHKDLFEEAKKFRQAILGLAPAYDAIEDAQTKRDLVKAKANGEMLYYNVTSFFVEAKKLRNLAGDIEWDISTEDPLLKKYEEQLKVTRQAYRNVKTYWEDHQEEAKKQLDSFSGLTWYLSAAKDFFDAATELSEKFKQPPQKRFSESDVHWRSGSMSHTIHGSPEKVGHTYSDLIKRMNELKYK